MNCSKNRIYYHDCDRSCIDSNYLNHLRSPKHGCNFNNLDLVYCISKLSLESDVGVQRDFSGKQNTKYKIIDPNILKELSRKYYSVWYNSEQSVAEAEAIKGELRRVGAVICEQYNIFLGISFVN